MALSKAYELLSDGTVALHDREGMWDESRLPLGSCFPSSISPGNWLMVTQTNGACKIITPDEVPKAIIMAHLIGM
jgi:hypothetical protein